MSSNSSKIHVVLILAIKLTAAYCSNPFETKNLHEPYIVPSITLSEIINGEGDDKLTDALTTTGIFSIVFDDGAEFSKIRELALNGLCKCTSSTSATDFTSKIDNSDFALLRDNLTTRTSIATATVFDEVPLSLPRSQIDSVCGHGDDFGISTSDAMEIMREYIHRAAQIFVGRLDDLIGLSSSQSKETLMRTDDGKHYSSFQSIIESATNLEHFHVYSKMQKIVGMDKVNHELTGNDAKPALMTHTDAGLFLSFAPAISCQTGGEESDGDDSAFMIQKEGSLRKAVFSHPETSVVIMLGTGAQNWIKNMPSELQLTATKHAVEMKEGTSRAWYGMMYLVPDNAIIQGYPHQATFSDMRHAMVSGSSKQTYSETNPDDMSNDVLSIGCGIASYDEIEKLAFADLALSYDQQPRHLHLATDATKCNNSTNFFCWMSCLDIPDLNVKQEDEDMMKNHSLYCADITLADENMTLAVDACRDESGVSGGKMEGNCKGVWSETIANLTSQNVTKGNEDHESHGTTRS